MEKQNPSSDFETLNRQDIHEIERRLIELEKQLAIMRNWLLVAIFFLNFFGSPLVVILLRRLIDLIGE